MNERIRARLEEMGATRIDTHKSSPSVGDPRLVTDFQTPMPGDQPIRSSLVVGLDGGVIKSTARFGVLDGSFFPTHPTEDPQQLARLRNIVRTPSFPNGALVLVNYGDTNRKPRPHILVGWTPSVADLDNEMVSDGNPALHPDVLDLIAYYEEVMNPIRREFRNEWVEETDDESDGETPSLRDLAPDSVLEDN